MDLLKGLRSYRGFKLRESSFPKFSASPSGETIQWSPKYFRGGKTCSMSSISISSLVGLGAAKNVEFFCLLVCDVRLACRRRNLSARFRLEGVRIQKQFWYRWIGEGCSCASAFKFLRTQPNGDTTKRQSPKWAKFWVFHYSSTTE